MLTKGEKRIVAFVITMVMSFTTVFSTGFVSHAEEVIQSQEMTVEAGKAYETQIHGTDGKELYEFIPEKTGSYQFYSVGDEDTYGYIYDSEKELLASANDGGEGMNFSIEGNLEAGQTYYLAVDYFLEQVQGTICWQIDYKGELQISDSIEEAESEVTEQVTEENQGEAEVYEAEPLKEQDYEYVIEEDGTVTITKYTGTDEEVTIPDSINGTTVSSIGEDAFANKTTLTKVTIPKNVTSLQYWAFRNCINLKNVQFEEESKLQSIQPGAFMSCEKLETFVCPDELERIGWSTFLDCTMLESVQFNADLRIIESQAFYGTGLKSVILPDNVTTIESGCFTRCYSLNHVELSNVVEIQGYAFQGCSQLEMIEFPDTLVTVGERAFEGTKWFSNQDDGIVYINSSAYAYKGKFSSKTSVDIKEGTKKISGYAFYGMVNLTDITLPSSVSEIGDYAFGNTGFEKVVLPDSLKKLGRGAFSLCKSLKEVKTGNGITKISDYAFEGCNVESLTIGNNIQSIGERSFASNLNLKEVIIPSNVSEIGACAFRSTGFEKIVLPDTLKKLGGGAFSLCKSLKEVKTGNGITEIPGYAFAECDLESLTIGNHVRSIGYEAFKQNMNLKEVIIPKNVTSIAYGAFNFCQLLETIDLPGTLETLGGKAFDNTRWYEKLYDNADDGVVYIDDFAYDYKGEMPENTSLEIKEGTKQISDYAFAGYSNLNSVILPDSVTEISDYAFRDCSNMKSIIIPKSVVKIGYFAVGVQHSEQSEWYYEPIPDFTIYGEAGSVAEIYAKEHRLNFVKSKYTVTFKDGDKVFSVQEVESGADAVPPEVPAKEGYVFTGWDGDYTNVKSDIILTAKWSYKDGWSKDSTGNWFYYENGKMVTGWKQIGRDYYYLHEDGHMAADEWIGDYYIDVNGVWQQNIVRAKWMNSNGKWWYRNEDGSYPANAWKMIDGKWYYFDVSGYSVTGWQQIGGLWYYFGTDRTMQTGWTQIGNQEYYFTSGGAMAVGWVIIDGNYHYFYSSGAHATNAWVGSYYVKADGTMAVSEWVDNTYYVNADGIYQTGWLKLDGKWYYLNNSGAKQTDWISVSGTWYYGEPATGALLEKEWLNDTYYFYAGGAMATGWVQIDGTYYYCNASGAKVTNTWVGNYYLKADGAMATNEWVDNDKYYVDENGVWDPNKVK